MLDKGFRSCVSGRRRLLRRRHLYGGLSGFVSSPDGDEIAEKFQEGLLLSEKAVRSWRDRLVRWSVKKVLWRVILRAIGL